MPVDKPLIPFEAAEAARKLGANMRTARLRRRLGQEDLAQKAGINSKTLRRLEQGEDGVSLGNVLSVLWALGLLPTAGAVADPDLDAHGKILEQARLPKRVRESAADNDF